MFFQVILSNWEFSFLCNFIMTFSLLICLFVHFLAKMFHRNFKPPSFSNALPSCSVAWWSIWILMFPDIALTIWSWKSARTCSCLYHDADLSCIYVFLPVCLLVEGLEKSASLASCDVGVDLTTSAQNAPASRQQRGKLSSLGKLFKPWKWRKKKTSDKFQDLSKGRMSRMF